MDYHSMKRKELQALCKKHNIPATSANSVMADKLSELLNEKRKPATRQRTCMKSLIETKDDDESGVSKRQAKKVRFSPDNELVEYELRSGKKQMAARRKCLPQKVEKPVVDDDVQIPVKLTRSRVQLVEKDAAIPNNGKKQDRKTVKDVVKGTNVVKEPEVNHGKVTRSKVHILGKRGADEIENANVTVEEPVVSRVRVTRSKAQTPMDDVKDSDVKLEVKKNSGKRAAKDVKIVEPVKENFDIPVRVTRSRRHLLKEDYEKTLNNPQNEKKRTRELKATDQTSSSSNVSPKRRSLRVKGVENVDENEDEKVEVVNGRKGTRSKAPLETRSSGRNSKNQADNKVEKTEENVGRKNVNRRKAAMQPEKTKTVVHLEESVNRRNTRRKTVEKEQSKGQSGNLSMIGEDLENKENEMKVVVNATGSPKSRKRVANPIIKDQSVETVHLSPVVESSKRSTRSGGKTEGKMVTIELPNSAKKQLESSPRKRAKLGDHSENINKTPVSKLMNNEKVSESEVTPVINKRFTRSAIKSEKKEAAIEEHDAMLSSHKVGKFKHGLVANTAPVRVTLTGTKQKAARNLSERVDKKKQLSKSTGPESDKLSTKVVEEENRVSLFEENDSGDSESNDKEKDAEQNCPDFSNLEDETAETNAVASLEAVPDAIPDVQNQVVNEKCAIFNEDEVEVAVVTSEKLEERVEWKDSENENADLGKSKEIEDPVDPPIIEEDGKHEITASEGEGVASPIIEDQTVETVYVSPAVEKFKHDPAVNTAPVRVTCTGVKQNAGSSLSERVDNKKQFSGPESDKLFVVENRVSVLEGLFEENESDDKVEDVDEQNPPDFPNLEDERNAVPAAIPDVQNQEVNERCATFNEDEVEVDVEKLQQKVELENSENDEEPLVSVAVEESVGNADLGKSNEMEDPADPSIIEEDEGDILEQLIDDEPKKEEVSSGKIDVGKEGVLSEDPNLDRVDEVTDNDEHESMPSNDENLVLSGTVDANEKSLTNNDKVEGLATDGNDTKIDIINIDSEGKNDVEKESAQKGVDEIPNLDQVDDEEGSEQGNSPLTDKHEHDDVELFEPVNDVTLSCNVIHGNDNVSIEPEDSSNANPVQNENVPVVTQVLTMPSSHEPEPKIGTEPETEFKLEPEQMLDVSVDNIACDTNVGVCSPVGTIDSPQTHAIAVTTPDVSHNSITAVSSIFGDIYGDGSATGCGIQQKVSENDMSNEQIPIETDNDHVSNDDKEPLPTLDHDLDAAYDLKINTQEDPTPNKQELSSQLMGDEESPITKESSPVTYGKAEKSIEVKTFTEETQKATTSLDWGNYDDTFQKPVSANENDDLSNEFHLPNENDDQSTKEQSCSPAVDFVKSVYKLEESARNVDDEEESDEDVNLLKSNVKMTEETLDDWSDLAIKSLFVTPGVGDVKEDGRNKTPAHESSRVFNVGSAEISGSQMDAVSFTFTSDKEHGTAANEFNRQLENESSTCEMQETKIPNFEHFSGKLFEDDHNYGMSSEAASAGDDEASGLKDNSVVTEKKEEEIQLKGSETGAD